MRVSEIRVKRIRVNQGHGVIDNFFICVALGRKSTTQKTLKHIHVFN